MGRIGQPVRAVRDICPGPDVSDPVRECVDITIYTVCEGQLTGEPVIFNRIVSHQMIVNRCQKVPMIGRGDLPVIGDLTHIP
jgi:hypothetical protein